MLAFIACIVTLILAPNLMATPGPNNLTSNYSDVPLEIQDGDRLIINGLRVNLRLIAASSGKKPILRARKRLDDKAGDKVGPEVLRRFETLGFQIRRERNFVILDVTGPDSKAAWVEWLRGGGGEMVFEIEAPSLPVEASLREGNVTIQGWGHPAAISLVDGVIRTKSTQGLLRLQAHRGEIRVEGHRGPLEIDSQSAKISLQGAEGEFKLTSFEGDATLSALKGPVDLTLGVGKTNASKVTGPVGFQLGRGSLTLIELDGALKGDIEQGTLSASVANQADVLIESQEGSVQLTLPPSSGALVKLKTEEGRIAHPDSLTPQDGDKRHVTGRLPGRGTKGRVSVTSKSGAIKLN
jgi:hypothetical protein